MKNAYFVHRGTKKQETTVARVAVFQTNPWGKAQKNPNHINVIWTLLVGITGLEPATSRPPDVCATNCAKSRSLRFAGAKLVVFVDICKFMSRKNKRSFKF